MHSISTFRFLTFILPLTALIWTESASAQRPELSFMDTRRPRETFKKLQPKEVRSEVSTFALSGISESVGIPPLEKISYSSMGPAFMRFEDEGIIAQVTLAPFDKDKHRLDYDEKHLIKIDRKTYYGNYGEIPKTEISNVLMIVQGDTLQIPQTAWSDLYNLNFTYLDKGQPKTTNAVYKSADGSRLYLYLFSKDKTGSYEVTWIFENNQYVRRVLDYDFM